MQRAQHEGAGDQPLGSEKKQRKSMARKTSSWPTRIYTYGASRLSPEAIKIVHDQLFKANQYRNGGTQVECERRGEYRELRDGLSPDLARLEKKYDKATTAYREARRQLGGLRRTERDSSPVVEMVRAKAKVCDDLYDQIKIERKAVATKFFKAGDEARKTLKETLVAEYTAANGRAPVTHTLTRINELVFTKMQRAAGRSKAGRAWRAKAAIERDSHTKMLAARAESGCYPGVYLAVDTAMRQSFQDSKFDPSFVRFAHRGRVGAQIHDDSAGPVTVERAMSAEGAPEIRIELHPEDAVHLTRAGLAPSGQSRDWTRRRAATAHIRLSGEDEVTISVPFVMHRPMPAGAVIKWVYLKVDRVGLRTTYQVQFTIELPPSEIHERKGLVDTLAANFGWRRMDDGSIRVATTYDGRTTQHVALPAAMPDSIEATERWLGHADDHFNDALKVAAQWWKGLAPSRRGVIAKAAKGLKLSYIMQWRSHGKLARLTHAAMATLVTPDRARELWGKWRAERLGPKRSRPERRARGYQPDHAVKANLFGSFDEIAAWLRAQGVRGDAVVALYLRWWCRKDRHLLDMARGCALRVQRHRREVYRVAAKDWARRYADVVIEKWDKSKTAQLPEPENDTRSAQQERASRLRQFVGVSLFVTALKEAFGKEHVRECPASGISREHEGCGGRASEAVHDVRVQCAKCERMFDQDVNAARALWRRDGERSGNGRTPGGSRKDTKDKSHAGLRDRSARPRTASVITAASP